MADWYVDADAGDDTSGDGTTWGTAWASLTHLFATVPTPSDGDQIVYVKGTQSIPETGWVVAAANQVWSWRWVLVAVDGASIVKTGRPWFAAARNGMAFSQFRIVRNYAANNYQQPSGLTDASFVDCSFSVESVTTAGYDGAAGACLYHNCVFNEYVSLYTNGVVTNSILNGANNYVTDLTFVNCLIRNLHLNWRSGNVEASFVKCSIDGMTVGFTNSILLIFSDCALQNIDVDDADNRTILMNRCATNAALLTTNYAPDNTDVGAGLFTDSALLDFTPTAALASVIKLNMVPGAVQPVASSQTFHPLGGA